MKGFTLIELMVVIVISAIVFSAGMASYRSFEEKYQIKQAGTEFQTNLRLFQKKAVSGEKPAECLGTFTGIRVRKTGDNSYAFQAECSAVNGDEQTVNLPGTVVFEASEFDLFFNTLNSSVTGAPETIILISDGSANSYEVIIEASGVINGGLQ